MPTTSSSERRNEPAGVGAIAFLIVYSVLLVAITGALWVSYFG